MEKTCILLVGPTAVGKTALAIQLAQHFSTSIISCDSRQCFTELNIGVAKPSAAELQKVPHFFINSHTIHQEVNAASFEKYALQKAATVFQHKNVVIVTGGTGLYAKAFCEGLDEVPVIDPQIRQNIISDFNSKGLAWLQQQVKQQDESFFLQGEIHNPQRLMRALEVKQSTGRSIVDFHSKQKKYRDFSIIKIGAELPRPQLIERINLRVDCMMKEGLLQEVKNILPYKQLNALQTVGYKEMFAYLDGEISLPQAVEEIKINTRQYAKRQMTWFKKDTEVKWCKPELDEVLSKINF
jgi:tRNA dimethylallyltransferase